MCFIFTCGETGPRPPSATRTIRWTSDQLTFLLEFSKQLTGYENLICQCRNCVSLPPTSHLSPSNPDLPKGNYSARVVKHHPWFTFCFIPVVPLSMHGYEDVVCSICNFRQPLANRPDVIEQARQMAQGGGGMPMQNQGPGGPPQGWGGGGGQPGNGPPKQQQPMQYA